MCVCVCVYCVCVYVVYIYIYTCVYVCVVCVHMPKLCYFQCLNAEAVDTVELVFTIPNNGLKRKSVWMALFEASVRQQLIKVLFGYERCPLMFLFVCLLFVMFVV